ncbi:GNAT family N-acetyltransferase [Streptomyces sp. NPDC021093]|uniref:GNAT family N-acetyltransferase n=1 Tax=Streptomyces sp. NPDC021093 TaxID=3365112 RepID=UPI0037BA0B55
MTMRQFWPGLIGDLAVARESDRGQAVVGITPAPDMRHRGCATEAMTAVVDRLLVTVQRITASCDARNTASAKLLRRVGFEQWGREKQYVDERGIHTEIRLFRMSGEQPRRP